MEQAKRHAIDSIVETLVDLTECTIDPQDAIDIATAAVEDALESAEKDGK